MLKKQKIISITSPKLRAVRFNLRQILVRAYYDQLTVLKALWLGAEGDEKLSLLRELENFRQKFRDSIVVCKICSQTDGDRVYIPRHRCWYCTDCLRKAVIPSLKKLGK
jgi:hypothetical protein